MNYLYLLMPVLGFGALGVLHKIADHRQCRPEAVNVLLFFWASSVLTAVCLFLFGPVGAVTVPSTAVWVATACGVSASMAVLFFQRGIRFGKISTSWLILNLSTAIPTVLSVVVYRESVSLKRAVSLGLAVVALLLLWQDRRQEEIEAQRR